MNSDESSNTGAPYPVSGIPHDPRAATGSDPVKQAIKDYKDPTDATYGDIYHGIIEDLTQPHYEVGDREAEAEMLARQDDTLSSLDHLQDDLLAEKLFMRGRHAIEDVQEATAIWEGGHGRPTPEFLSGYNTAIEEVVEGGYTKQQSMAEWHDAYDKGVQAGLGQGYSDGYNQCLIEVGRRWLKS